MQLNNILSKISGLLSMTCLCLFFLACSSDHETTDGNIMGLVISSRTNEPLQGVSVTLTNNGKNVITGKDGRYQFTNLPSQDYTVQVSKENYATDTKTIFVRAGEDNILDFSMFMSTGAFALSRNSFDFGTETTVQTLTITNSGQAVINWQVSENAEWITCLPASGVIHAGETGSLTISVDRAGLAKGQYKHIIAITSSAGSADVEVNMTVAGLKDVIVDPTELDFGSTTTSLQLSMKNTGTKTVGYALEASNEWIKLSRNSGSFSQNEVITVSVDRTQLAAGDYTGNITIRVADKTQDVPVKMNIPQRSIPTVALYSVDNITISSALAKGAVVQIGSSNIMRHGFCWGASEHPDVSLETKCNFGDCRTAKDFNYTIPNLKPGTRYYVRAYAENSAGVAYSDEISFMTISTPQKPTVETGDVSDIESDAAVVGGNLLSIGVEEGVTEYGHVWSTHNDPTIYDNYTQLGSTNVSTSFSSKLTNLIPSTTYYVRAYATNKLGTSYGEIITFTTGKQDKSNIGRQDYDDKETQL